MKCQLLGKALHTQLQCESRKDHQFRLDNPKQIMNVQNQEQTKQLECLLHMRHVVLIVSLFDICVSIKQKCLTMTKIEIEYANRIIQTRIEKGTSNLSHEADLLPITETVIG